VGARNHLFKSFWQGGFECSTHVLRTGKRLDLAAATGHGILAKRDYARLREIGMLTAREGLRWHVIEKEPGQYDFSSVLPFLEAARSEGIQIIWDLLHFGWPGYLDIFADKWVEAFANFAGAFGRYLRSETADRAFIAPVFVAPVNEISFFSWAGGDIGYLNPFAKGRGPELKRQLVKGALRASDAVRAELPEVRLVSPEPVIHIAGNPNIPDDVRQAEEYRSSMFEAWDMIAGRAQPELGGNESYLDVIGVNYYDRNQWWNYGDTIRRNEPQYRPFGEILAEVCQRYQRPVFISETGCEDFDRPFWLAYIAEQTRAAMRAGSRIEGICLYPILNHAGWDDDRHCFNGLWDYPKPDGEREIYQPLADEIQRQQNLTEQIYDSANFPARSTRFDLPVSSAMEFRIPASPALNEQICAIPPRVFR
jgi:hypothetical protein